MEARSLKSWKTIIDNLITQENSTFREFMIRNPGGGTDSPSAFYFSAGECPRSAPVLPCYAFWKIHTVDSQPARTPIGFGHPRQHGSTVGGYVVSECSSKLKNPLTNDSITFLVPIVQTPLSIFIVVRLPLTELTFLSSSKCKSTHQWSSVMTSPAIDAFTLAESSLAMRNWLASLLKAVSHVRPFSSPDHGQANVTAPVGQRGERISQSATLSEPSLSITARQRSLDRMFAVAVVDSEGSESVADWLMRSPLRSTGAVTLVCPWAGEENSLTCDTAFICRSGRWKRSIWKYCSTPIANNSGTYSGWKNQVIRWGSGIVGDPEDGGIAAEIAGISLLLLNCEAADDGSPESICCCARSADELFNGSARSDAAAFDKPTTESYDGGGPDGICCPYVSFGEGGMTVAYDGGGSAIGRPGEWNIWMSLIKQLFYILCKICQNINRMLRTGYQLGYGGFQKTTVDPWPWGEGWYKTLVDVSVARGERWCIWRVVELETDTLGKFTYKTEGRYSVGTLGYEDVDCDFIDLTYVCCSSAELQKRLKNDIAHFSRTLRRDEGPRSKGKGKISLEFYQKKRAWWPFHVDTIPWEAWDVSLELVQLRTESDKAIFREKLGAILADKIIRIAQVVNRNDYVPKIPDEKDLDLVFDTSFEDVQPYLFQISYVTTTPPQMTMPHNKIPHRTWSKTPVRKFELCNSGLKKKFLFGDRFRRHPRIRWGLPHDKFINFLRTPFRNNATLRGDPIDPDIRRGPVRPTGFGRSLVGCRQKETGLHRPWARPIPSYNSGMGSSHLSQLNFDQRPLYTLDVNSASAPTGSSETQAEVVETPARVMTVQPLATFNHGKPFLAERDPVTGARPRRIEPSPGHEHALNDSTILLPSPYHSTVHYEPACQKFELRAPEDDSGSSKSDESFNLHHTSNDLHVFCIAASSVRVRIRVRLWGN
ncbi:unnamed protein product [Nesidiocoris tenuis]|uniref:Autophagy-related protein 101 n=1 Tax=Nesidiocoris tenuis TaxID=355587 RepID=A0A6H5GUF6_9HEMI|nr:unnamed protein product [Nesidiocoris tenuis]